MARRAAVKKPPKQTPLSQPRDSKDAELKEPKIEDSDDQFIDPDVERQCAAIRAIRDIEIARLLTEIRLLRSHFDPDQLQTNALRFFAENFPELSVVKSTVNGQIEIQCGTDDIARDAHASLLHRLTVARSDFPAPFSSSFVAEKTRLLAPDSLRIRDFVLEEEPSETRILGIQDSFQTPGISSQRLSIGMTPKTLRLPKPGEMLLSVRGSPLGVYKEDNMEAICESEES